MYTLSVMRQIRALATTCLAPMGPDAVVNIIWYGLMALVAFSALLGGLATGNPAAMLASALVAAMVYFGLRNTAE